MASNGIPSVVESLRKSFQSGRTRPLGWREGQLSALIKMLKEREGEFTQALTKDLGKPQFESFTAELAFVIQEAVLSRKNLRKWARPEKVSTPLVAQPGKSEVRKDPLGVTLVIGAWNYPVQLTLAPLIGAIAAGNCAVVKPSEVAAHTSALLAKLVPLYLDQECIRIVEGAIQETTELLDQKWDLIFYTGNGNVAKVIMAAATKNLTPVVLELGGKSPCIVDSDADVTLAARRIAWGKFYNAGQTCTAPDYVLVKDSVEAEFVDGLKGAIREFYGDNPKKSPDFARIVNQRHHQRVRRLIDGSGEVALGGEADEADRYIAPTVLRNVKADAPVMAEEIFGPVLPVLKVKETDEAIEFVNSRPKPLALYLFTRSSQTQEKVVTRTSSGGVCVNHTILHVANPNLPFGGVGASGMGAYHGKASFDVFTHKKSVMSKPNWIDPGFIYPPYTEGKFGLVKKLI
ncbi:MAG: aldehyde dehydrogenase family protein [Bdellovibrionota bacterium]